MGTPQDTQLSFDAARRARRLTYQRAWIVANSERMRAYLEATREARKLKAKESRRRLKVLEAALLEAHAAARAARGGADPTPAQLAESRRIGEALAEMRTRGNDGAAGNLVKL